MRLILTHLIFTFITFKFATARHEPFRIVGGEIAEPHQFPYQVGIRLYKENEEGEYTSCCGGTLLSKKFVLTAAHCLDNTARVLLYFATHNRWENEESGRVTIKANRKDFIVHEKYVSKFLYNDIALISIPGGVKVNGNIKTINLRKHNEINLAGKIGIATGWGKAGQKIGSSDVLRFVQMQILENKACNKFGEMLLSQLCGDGKGPKSTCEGDSGGPLVVEDKNGGSKTIVGITSFGASGSCEKAYPYVFTRVSYYLDWIGKHTGIIVK